MEKNRSRLINYRIPLVFLLIVVFLLPDLFAQKVNQSDYKITLQSRTFIPQPGIESAFKDSMIVQLKRGEKRHVHVQLKKHLTVEERSELEKQGIKLLSYIGAYTWYATVSDQKALSFVISDSVSRRPVLGTMRWIGEISDEDRIAPVIMTTDAEKWVKTEDNRERYVVYFFKDVSIDDARQLITRLGGEIEGEENLTKGFFVIMPSGSRDNIMKMDNVKLIDLYPPPPMDQNNGSRGWCNTNPVHLAGITGTGVILGLWEATGHPRNTHVDLTVGRCHHEDGVNVSEHATHVCGTIMGTGAGTVAFMGHAPGVPDIHCYLVDNVAHTNEVALAIPTHGIVACNNSWGYGIGWAWANPPGPPPWGWYFEYYNPQSIFGDYRWSCPAYDELVCDSGLVVVFAAGNERDDPPGGIETNAQPGDWDQIAGAGTASWDGFHTIGPEKTAKNVITVGAINDATGAMATFSGWGPTDDGRIKPDVVAPGVSINSCDDTNTDGMGGFNDYTLLGGTSMAAPAVTGIVALLIQSYRDEYLDTPTSDLTPLPSTIKALLCQSADDMGNVGPDYQFGYGGVRADAARQLILDKRFLEGVMLSGTDQDVYNFQVAAGDPEIRFTLAWDDHPAAATNPIPALINDLDLVIQDPAGNYYTPWHLHITAHNQAINPATRNLHAVASTNLIPVADRDRWNNVEQVFIDPILTGGPLVAGNWKVIVEAHALPEAPQRYSLVGNYNIEGEVDVVQVLDRSGSMGGTIAPGSTTTKIEMLRHAAQQFIDIMKPDIGNRLGLVQFNHNVVPFIAAHDANLSELTTLRAPIVRNNAVPSITQGGATSIGDGLAEAQTQFSGLASPNSDQVILLVTDGKENSTQMISAAQPGLIGDEIAVYPLGLGYGSGIDEDKLTDLAEATGGSYRITSDELIFKKWFIEILAGAVDWSVLTDPIYELEPNEFETIPVKVTADQIGITFTAYWEAEDDAIQLEIITPSGTPITSATINAGIRSGNHPRYSFYQLDFPLAGSMASEWAGEWKMKITGSDQITEKVRCSASAYGEGGTELEVAFDKLYHLTGDQVKVKARIVHAGKAVPGANVNVYCNVPKTGAGNMLFEGKVNPDELNKNRVINGDTLSLIDNKLRILAEQAGKDIFERSTSYFKLFDDGKHGDGEENDGLYSNNFAATDIQGSYTFRFVASDIPTPSGQKITREWTKSFYNEVNIDPKYSIIDVNLISRVIEPDRDGWNYAVKVAPKDKFNNYRGPGRPVFANVKYDDYSRQVQFTDNIDGTYTKDIYVSQSELDQGAKLVIEIDGKTFTTLKFPPPQRWGVSIHSGYAIPQSNFANSFDPGVNFLLDAGYWFNQEWALIGFAGYNDFRSKITGVDDNKVWNLSLNLRHYREFSTMPGSAWSYYIGGGLGGYFPDVGNSEFGFNIGVGVNHDVSSTITAEVGADYHKTFDTIEFIHSHVGIIIRL